MGIKFSFSSDQDSFWLTQGPAHFFANTPCTFFSSGRSDGFPKLTSCFAFKYRGPFWVFVPLGAVGKCDSFSRASFAEDTLWSSNSTSGFDRLMSSVRVRHPYSRNVASQLSHKLSKQVCQRVLPMFDLVSSTTCAVGVAESSCSPAAFRQKVRCEDLSCCPRTSVPHENGLSTSNDGETGSDLNGSNHIAGLDIEIRSTP